MAKRPQRLSDLPLDKKVDELLEGHYTNSKDSDGHSTTTAVPDYILAQAGWVLEMMPEFRSKQAVIRDCLHIGMVLRVQQIESGKFETEFDLHQLRRLMESMEAEEHMRMEFLSAAPGFIQTATTNEQWNELEDWMERAKRISSEWGGAQKISLDGIIARLEGALEFAEKKGWVKQQRLAVVREIGYSDERYEEMFGSGGLGGEDED